MKVELDCGCTVSAAPVAWHPVGWHDCPNGHGPQRVRYMTGEGLYQRHLVRRSLFVDRYGLREITEGE